MPKVVLARRRKPRRKTWYSKTQTNVVPVRRPAPKRSLSAAMLLPSKKVVNFTYRQLVRVVGVAGTTTLIQTRLNSMYDFDVTNVLGDHQPQYYDQLVSASMYNQYRVLGWKTTWKISSAQSVPLYCSYLQSALATDADTFDEQINRPGSQTRLIAGVNGGNVRAVIIKARGTPTKFIANDPVALTGAYNGSPGSLCYGNLLIWDPAATTAPTCDIEIIHVFKAYLNDRRIIGS